MAERAQQLTAHFHTSEDDPLALTTLSSEQVGKEASLLVDSLNALPMLGGMASTLILSLIVIPAIYYIRVGLQIPSDLPRAEPDNRAGSFTPEGEKP